MPFEPLDNSEEQAVPGDAAGPEGVGEDGAVEAAEGDGFPDDQGPVAEGDQAVAAEPEKIGLKQRVKTLPPAEMTPWGQVWQVPGLLLGGGLLLLGVYLNWPEKKEDQFHEILDQAEQYIEARDLDQAGQTLAKVGAKYNFETTPLDVKARYQEIEGDKLYLELTMSQGLVDTEVGRKNQREILEQYKEAESLYEQAREEAEAAGDDIPERIQLDDQSLHWKARVLVAMGEREEALELVDQLKAAKAAPQRRYSLVRSLIEQDWEDLQNRQTQDEEKTKALFRLLKRYHDELRAEKDVAQKIKQLVWMYRLEAEIRIAAQDLDRAIDDLIQAIQRINGLEATVDGLKDSEAPMLADLGRAYLAKGNYEIAEQKLKTARRKLDPGDAINAEVLVALGDIALSKPGGGVEQAQEYFEEVVSGFKGEDAYVDGLVGLADTQARGTDGKVQAKAIQLFNEAVDELNDIRKQDPRHRWTKHHQNAADRIETHADFLVYGNDFEMALTYLQMLVRLYGEGNEPVDLLKNLADTYWSEAQRLDQLAEEIDLENPPPGVPVDTLAKQQSQRRLEAAVHFENAADYFVSYARLVPNEDDEGHGEGLWKAAEAYDRAQRPEKAVEIYSEFTKTRADDPRLAEAMNRLGRAYMTLEQYEAAIEQFDELKKLYPQSTWAADGVIPEATCYAKLNQLDEAERLLTSVLSNHPTIRPESEEYREALIALGALYYSRGGERPGYFEQSISYLDQAVKRYGDSSEGPRLRYLLADSYRQSVPTLRETAETKLLQSDRMAYDTQVRERLETARDLYQQVRQELEAKPKEMLSDLQKLYHRNAYFYEADTVYDLGDLKQAIELYGNAASRWQGHPAALMAMVQIVNAHCRLNQWDQARVANNQAQDLLASLDDEVFEDASLPGDRSQWEEWLMWTSELEDRVTSGG